MGVQNLRQASAWSEFWQDQHVGTSCCAGAPDLRRRLDAHWRGFATTLPPRARVLDLGCGAGAVGQALIAASPWLRVTGVDFAAVPPPADRRIETLAGTAMEAMPFADASFDAATSQFGFEYGDLDRTALELARVLRRGGRFSLLVHHSEGRIAADSAPHRRALEAIGGPRLEAAFLSGNGEVLARELAAIRLACPGERIVEEAAQGIARHIGFAAPHRAAIWRAISAALEPELVMLAELQASWVSPERMQGWLAPLAGQFDLEPPRALQLVDGSPLCWMVEGARK